MELTDLLDMGTSAQTNGDQSINMSLNDSITVKGDKKPK